MLGIYSKSSVITENILSTYHAVHAVLSHLSCVLLFVTPWTVAPQVPLSMEFSRQEHWSGLPFCSLEGL